MQKPKSYRPWKPDQTAAAAARQEEAEKPWAKATAAEESKASATEQAELSRKAEAAAAKAKAAKEKAIEAAETAGLEPTDLETHEIRLRCPGAVWLGKPTAHQPRKPSETTAPMACGYTDPDSHLMQSGGTYLQGYNCQLEIDSDHQVIVAVGVSNQPPDAEHLEPMQQRIATSAGEPLDVMTLDEGYWSEDNAKGCADQGIPAYIATGRLPHGQPLPPKRDPIPFRRAKQQVMLATMG